MLIVRQEYFEALEQIRSPATAAGRAELGDILQQTLKLEHATIPPYLTAAYSLEPPRNRAIRDLIVRIAKEEMLHMTVIANLMNAIGVSPRLNEPTFIPEYPTELPLLETDGFKVHLKAFSPVVEQTHELIKATFMRIETPEKPRKYPDLDVELEAATEEPRTIGALYDRIIEIIESGAVEDLFRNAERDAYKQITLVHPGEQRTASVLDPRFPRVQIEPSPPPLAYPLPPEIDFKIVDAATAVRHLRWIVDQGEGTDKQPIDAKGLPAHYYRFESIVNEEYLIRNPDFAGDQVYDGGYSFSGAALKLDPTAVHEFDPNPRLEDYDGPLHEAMKNFQQSYRSMLNHLHNAFNCRDDSEQARLQMTEDYEASKDLMISLPGLARQIKLRAQEDPQHRKGGLPFGGPPTV